MISYLLKIRDQIIDYESQVVSIVIEGSSLYWISCVIYYLYFFYPVPISRPSITGCIPLGNLRILCSRFWNPGWIDRRHLWAISHSNLCKFCIRTLKVVVLYFKNTFIFIFFQLYIECQDFGFFLVFGTIFIMKNEEFKII